MTCSSVWFTTLSKEIILVEGGWRDWSPSGYCTSRHGMANWRRGPGSQLRGGNGALPIGNDVWGRVGVSGWHVGDSQLFSCDCLPLKLWDRANLCILSTGHVVVSGIEIFLASLKEFLLEEEGATRSDSRGEPGLELLLFLGQDLLWVFTLLGRWFLPILAYSWTPAVLANPARHRVNAQTRCLLKSD